MPVLTPSSGMSTQKKHTKEDKSQLSAETILWPAISSRIERKKNTNIPRRIKYNT
jgi:hypothetical protein